MCCSVEWVFTKFSISWNIAVSSVFFFGSGSDDGGGGAAVTPKIRRLTNYLLLYAFENCYYTRFNLASVFVFVWLSVSNLLRLNENWVSAKPSVCVYVWMIWAIVWNSKWLDYDCKTNEQQQQQHELRNERNERNERKEKRKVKKKKEKTIWFPSVSSVMWKMP